MRQEMSSTRSRASVLSPIDAAGLVTGILEGYANNGVFRGFSVSKATRNGAKYTIVWHYDCRFELVFKAAERTLTLRRGLTSIRSSSPMYRELQSFVEDLHSPERPAHRRIDPVRTRLHLSNRAGDVSIKINLGKDLEYGTRKFIHGVNEIFVVFLQDGPYTEYFEAVFNAAFPGS